MPVESQNQTIPSSPISEPPLSDIELRYELAPYVRGRLSLDQLVSLYREYESGTRVEAIGRRFGVSVNCAQRWVSRLVAGGLLVARHPKARPDVIEGLRELWGKGYTTRAIASELGVTKGTITGLRNGRLSRVQHALARHLHWRSQHIGAKRCATDRRRRISDRLTTEIYDVFPDTAGLVEHQSEARRDTNPRPIRLLTSQRLLAKLHPSHRGAAEDATGDRVGHDALKGRRVCRQV